MATIKQISEKSGYSPSTVSIVLRGLSTARGIPESTQKIIMATARELGYQPNVSARRLRSSDLEKKNIAVFWASDFRAILVAQFLQGLQRYIVEQNLDFEMIVCPYTPDNLCKSATQRTLNMYSGAIICTASLNDINYIEHLDTTCPIVLYNRISERFPCVGVDNHKIGRAAAKKFYMDSCKRVMVIADRAGRGYSRQRINGCIDELIGTGIPVEEVFIDANSIFNGRKCVRTLPPIKEKTGMFVMSDYVAFGILDELNKQQISIPDQIEIISIGTSEPELYHCLHPSLSVIMVPIEEMAYHCAEVLNDRLSRITQEVVKVEVPFCIRFAESTLPDHE